MIDFLGRNNVRELDLKERDLDYRRLEKFLFKVNITVEAMGGKTKTIRSLVPAAGNYVFDKNGEEITVLVCLFFQH